MLTSRICCWRRRVAGDMATCGEALPLEMGLTPRWLPPDGTLWRSRRVNVSVCECVCVCVLVCVVEGYSEVILNGYELTVRVCVSVCV